MQNTKKLTLAVLIQAALISTAFASEQSESKGFVEDAEGSVLFRTGYLSRDKKNGVADTSSAAQTAIVKLDSGFTQGVVGFGAGIIGDASFIRFIASKLPVSSTTAILTLKPCSNAYS